MRTLLLRRSNALHYATVFVATVFVFGVALTTTRTAVAQPPADSSSEDAAPGRVVIERLGDPDPVPVAE